MSATHARYAQQEGAWIIELSGDIRHPLGPALNAVLDQAFATPGTSQFLIDLSDVDTIDSTCLGVLAKVANWSHEHAVARPVIASPGKDVTATLCAICLDRLFELRDQPLPTVGFGWNDIVTHDVGAGYLSATVLEAHQRLSEIDEKNATAFRGVVEALQSEADRERGRGRH